MASEVASRYADGLMALARENHTVPDKKEMAEAILKVYEQEPLLRDFFASVKITDAQKKAFIDQVFGASLDQDMIHLLKLLVDKDRMYYIRDILEDILAQADEELGIQQAMVYSARELPKEDLEKIRKALAAQTGREIHLRTKIDPSLIAGIKVVVGNRVTDATMKSRVEGMKRALLKGGQA